MRVAVKVLLKKEILDLQGRAITALLKDKKIKKCFVGKYIILDFQIKDKKQVLKEARKIASQLLADELTEDFEIEILSS